MTVATVSSWLEQHAKRKTKKSDQQMTVIQVSRWNLLALLQRPSLQEQESRPLHVKSEAASPKSNVSTFTRTNPSRLLYRKRVSSRGSSPPAHRVCRHKKPASTKCSDDTDVQLLLPLLEARSFRQHRVRHSDTARVELRCVTRSCPKFVGDFPSFEWGSRQLHVRSEMPGSLSNVPKHGSHNVRRTT